jgi:hypothetical protein
MPCAKRSPKPTPMPSSRAAAGSSRISRTGCPETRLAIGATSARC